MSTSNYQVMSGRKLDKYFNQGFVKNKSEAVVKESELKKIRAFYKKEKGYERVVLDFSTDKLPKTMVYLSSDEKRLMVTMLGTSRDRPTIPKKTEMFSTYNVFKIDDSTTVEMTFRRPKEIDVFYLESPARLVIDARVDKNKR